MSDATPLPKERRFYCSLCTREASEIPFGLMVAVFDTNICNGCVLLLQEVVWQWRHAEWLQYKDLAP